MEMDKQQEMDLLVKLELLKNELMQTHGVLISVYTNASGYLYSLMKTDGGTDLGDSDFEGDNQESGTFSSYRVALQDAVALVQKCTLAEYHKKATSENKDQFHWGNYFNFVNTRYRNGECPAEPNLSSVEKLYVSKETLIDTVLKERQRAVKIAYTFHEDRLKEYDSKVKAEKQVYGDQWKSKSIAFIKKELSEEARLIGNAISGGNALSEALGESMRDRIVKKLT